MPDNTRQAKRLHLERLVARETGSHEYARDFVRRVIEMHEEPLRQEIHILKIMCLTFASIPVIVLISAIALSSNR